MGAWCLLCTILTCPTAGIKIYTALTDLDVPDSVQGGWGEYFKAGNDLLTIHRMEPVGCSTCWDPLHLDLTVASPKSPIFTVRPSWRNISVVLLKKLQRLQSIFLFSDLISKCCLFYWNLLGAACGAKEKGFYNEHLTLNQSRCCSIICRFIFMVSQDRNQQFIGCSSLNNWERETAHRSRNSEIFKKSNYKDK